MFILIVVQKLIIFPFSNIYVCIENILKYEGVISENQTSQMDTMQSPFFPNFYPRDLVIEHLIVCSSNDTSPCHIEITFLDFLISSSSAMEVNAVVAVELRVF